MNQIFDWCVRALIVAAHLCGMTYKAINVWIFVILWPVFTLLLVGVIVWQRRTIVRLR